MALKTYIGEEKQAFFKRGNNNLLFGIQYCRTFALPPIKDAFYSGSNTSATSVKLVKVNQLTLEDGEETTLSNSVITYSDGQFKIDQNVDIGTMEAGCVYYIQFENGENRYKTEPFFIQKFNQKLLASGTWLASDTDILASDTNIII